MAFPAYPELRGVCMVSFTSTAAARHGPFFSVGFAPVLFVKVRPRFRLLAARARQ